MSITSPNKEFKVNVVRIIQETDYSKHPAVLFKMTKYIDKLNIRDRKFLSKIQNTFDEDF